VEAAAGVSSAGTTRHCMAFLGTTMNPRRILHVTGALNRGGIQISLLHMLKSIDRVRYPMDFLVFAERGLYADEIERLGSRVFLCPRRNVIAFARDFTRILRENGPYDVVHSHVHYFNGLILFLAAKSRVPLRIAHARNDWREARREQALTRRIYKVSMRRLIGRYSTLRIAISSPAADDLFGPGWRGDMATLVIPTARDLAPFANQSCDVKRVRASLGIPETAIVLGHVGRFVPQKNHVFLLQVARSVRARDPRMHLLLVGDGPLRNSIEALVEKSGLRDRVTFTGEREHHEVARLMMSAMDVFVFPSLHEGLGGALIESQAAGLPCVVSDRIPAEACLLEPLIHRLPLHASPETWAAAIIDVAPLRPIKRTIALRHVMNSDFNIEKHVRIMSRVYDGNIPLSKAR
jgi:glycosyltransferase involved in cell wall biosynthesis